MDRIAGQRHKIMRNRDPFLNARPISFLAAAHKVSIEYPVLSELRPGEEQVFPPPIALATERYDPCEPLVADRDVVANAGWDALDQNNFVSVYPAYPKTFLRIEGQSLTDDMKKLVTLPGFTTLYAVDYRREADREDVVRSRIKRVTILYTSQGRKEQSRSYYEFEGRGNLHPFESIQGSSRDQRWICDLLELALRETNRAVKHVNILLEDIPAEQREERRDLQSRMQYRIWEEFDYTLTKISASEVPRSEARCSRCSKFLGDKGVVKHLRCHRTHLLCMVCKSKLCKEPFPDVDEEPWLRCQYVNCGRPFFPSFRQDLLVYNTWDGICHDREDYSTWENFQLSCSDLDKVHVASNPESEMEGYDFRIDCPGPMIFEIWLDLCLSDDDPELEDRRYTLAPEFYTIMRAMAKVLTKSAIELTESVQRRASAYLSEEPGSSTLKFAIIILFGVMGQLVDELIQNGGRTYFSESELEAARNGENVDMIFRPGMDQFLTRNLNRTLRFLQLRQCSCEDSLAGLPANLAMASRKLLYQSWKHKHGNREFYDVEVYRQFVSIGDEIELSKRAVPVKSSPRGSQTRRGSAKSSSGSYSGIAKNDRRTSARASR
ncbi:hypothetical protein HII31_10086 [Pseudocercospora fuligena]|uniref:Uncharacterized protein n=1 Tax=Pseudocercospora fuligena TaxID=685502 RepID=A0A8H6RB87_9PEZI|nr:hypothetical protein HII31_10086 [Pseudocercospora fuligena]